MATKTKPTDTAALGDPVLVTTVNKGIFFGYVSDRSKAPTSIKLARARCCIRFANTRGFLGLTADGPNADCRVGPAAATLELFNITSIADLSEKAVAAWESAPWRR